MDAVLDAVHRLLLLHLHRVAQAQGPKEQLLVLLEEEWGGRTVNTMLRVKLKKENPIQNLKKKRKRGLCSPWLWDPVMCRSCLYWRHQASPGKIKQMEGI